VGVPSELSRGEEMGIAFPGSEAGEKGEEGTGICGAGDGNVLHSGLRKGPAQRQRWQWWRWKMIERKKKGRKMRERTRGREGQVLRGEEAVGRGEGVSGHQAALAKLKLDKAND